MDSFNLPLYTPTAEEARKVIEAEGSFTLKRLQNFGVDWDANMTHDKYTRRNCCQYRESSGRAHSEKPLWKRDY